MGTSNTYGGPKSGLVPPWADGPTDPPSDQQPEDGSAPDKLDANGNDDGRDQPNAAPPPASRPTFQTPRSNFTRFTNSGDTKALGRAVNGYVASTGGSSGAVSRMPASTRAAKGVAGFVNAYVSDGPQEALRRFSLEGYAGRAAVDVLDAVADAICPDGGTIDEAIARDAMFEAIADLDADDLGAFEDLSQEQLSAFLSDVIARSIVTKVINEIGTNSLHGSASDTDFKRAEEILRDYTGRAVNDALGSDFDAGESLSTTEIESRIDNVFQDAFDILQVILEGE